jgi:hypothetical protein
MNEFHVVFIVHLDINFQFFNQRMNFLFSYFVQFIDKFNSLDQWTVKWTYHFTPDDGRVTAETYVGWIKQNTKIKSAFVG